MTTTHSTMPAAGTLVELTGAGEPIPGVCVDAADGTELVLSLPDAASPVADLPRLGHAVTLHWPAGPRGRYVVDGTVIGLPGHHRWTVELDGDPRIEQSRQYVRGGGGEQVRLHRSDKTEVAGLVQDISEQGVRARFEDPAIGVGDRLRLSIELGDDTVEVAGAVYKARELTPSGGPQVMRVEVVVVFDADEAQARVIRRYVLQQQMLARTRLAGD